LTDGVLKRRESPLSPARGPRCQRVPELGDRRRQRPKPSAWFPRGTLRRRSLLENVDEIRTANNCARIARTDARRAQRWASATPKSVALIH
jgi:hypothetical protein